MSNLKQILSFIEKYGVAPPKNSSPEINSSQEVSEKLNQNKQYLSNKPTGTIFNKIPSVFEMQQAILNFANVASATDITSMQGNKEGRTVGVQRRDIDGTIPVLSESSTEQGTFAPAESQQGADAFITNPESLKGSDAFGSYLVNNFIPQSTQYINTDISGNKNREDASTIGSNLRGIIDSIKRIGSPSAGEKAADGIWQTRTNNALFLIKNLVDGMLKFTSALNIKTNYSQTDLNELSSAIPQSYTDLKSSTEIDNRAKILTPLINKATSFFTELNSKVFNDSNIKDIANQKEPLFKYKKTVKLNEIDKNKTVTVNINNKMYNVTLNDLSNPMAFQTFIVNNKIPVAKPEELATLLNNISEQLK